MRAWRGFCHVAVRGGLTAVAVCSFLAVDGCSSKSRTVDISANMTHQYLAMQVRRRCARVCHSYMKWPRLRGLPRVCPTQDDMNSTIDNKEAKILELQDALQLSRRGTNPLRETER